jgi:RNA polymerase sigma factor (sigma-70 family)
MSDSYQESDQQLIESLKQGDTRALQNFYSAHRREFIGWVQKAFGYPPEEATDIYQDAIIVVYENILSEKITTLKASLKTYLFSIGKNKLLRKIDKDKRMESEPESVPMLREVSTELDDEQELHARYQAFADYFETMGDPCKSILYLYYFKNLAMQKIAAMIGYKSEDVVKSQKVRCLKTLKTAVLQKLKRN